MVARQFFVGRRTLSEQAERAKYHHPHLDKELGAENVRLPIDPSEVYAVASKGFPVWEPIHILQLRNRRITVAYADLSRRLSSLIGGDDESSWDANWCTFAVWSSKTIGDSINEDPDSAGFARALSRMPAAFRQPEIQIIERLVSGGHEAMYRSLALGNRFVFLEIATALTRLLAFCEAQLTEDDEAFDECCREIVTAISELQRLDPSWVAPRSRNPIPLCEGLRAYYRAHYERDAKRRSELVLIGNIYVVGYEQRRVQAFVGTALSMFTAKALRRIVQGRSSRYGPVLLQRLSWLYALYVTRNFLTLNLAGQLLRVGRPIPAPGANKTAPLRFPKSLEWIENPVLQALLTSYDLSDGRPDRTYANNWISYADRMNYIVNLFRGYQRERFLFAPPWPANVQAKLLAGILAP